MPALLVGQTAPAFSLNGIDGKPYLLEKNGARLTLAVFFKTTCPTCMMAFPYVEKIHQAYRAGGLAVWGVSQHDRQRSAAFASQYSSTFPVLIDDTWRVSQQYDPQFVPTLFLIDPSGKIIDSVVSFDKAGLNRLSHAIAEHLSVTAVTIAAENDGNPVFKPG